MNSEIYEHCESVYRNQFSEVMTAVKDKLYETIYNLGSDEALKQLNLDKSLRGFKFDRIKEIVNQTFDLTGLLGEETAELSKYKNECFELKAELQSRRNDHLSTLQQVQKRFSDYKKSIDLQRSSLGCLHQKANDQQEEINHYKMTIRSMQEDMLRIKTQWERKCKQIERQSIQQSKFLVEETRRQAQAKLDLWLEHISKQQGQLIIREDQKLIEQAKQQHMREIKKLKQTHQMEIQQLEESINSLRTNQKRLKQQIKQSQNQLHEFNRSQQSKQLRFKQQNKLLKSQLDVIIGKNQQIVRQKLVGQRKLAGETQGLMVQLNNTSLVVESKQQQIFILKEKILNLEYALKQLKQNKHKLTTQLSEKDNKNTQLEAKIMRDKDKDKQMRDKLKQVLLRLQGIKLQSNRLKNQYNIEKDTVKYELSNFKRRINSLKQQMIQYVTLQSQKHEVRYNTKLNSIMYQFDINQKTQNMALEQALKDNEYLRAQLTEYEQSFENKLEELKRQKYSSRSDVEQQIYHLKNLVVKMVKSVQNEKAEVYERVRVEIQKRECTIQDLTQQNDDLVSKNRQLNSQLNKRSEQFQDYDKSKRTIDKELNQLKAEMMVKDKMLQEYGKQTKQKQNVRGNTNRQNREKQMEEIRAMLVKTYQAVGSQPPEKHRRKI